LQTEKKGKPEKKKSKTGEAEIATLVKNGLKKSAIVAIVQELKGLGFSKMDALRALIEVSSWDEKGKGKRNESEKEKDLVEKYVARAIEFLFSKAEKKGRPAKALSSEELESQLDERKRALALEVEHEKDSKESELADLVSRTELWCLRGSLAGGMLSKAKVAVIEEFLQKKKT